EGRADDADLADVREAVEVRAGGQWGMGGRARSGRGNAGAIRGVQAMRNMLSIVVAVGLAAAACSKNDKKTPTSTSPSTSTSTSPSTSTSTSTSGSMA